MKFLPFRRLVTAIALLLMANASLALADDGEAVDMKKWDQLIKRQKEIMTRIPVLQKEYRTADLAQRTTIKEEFEKLREEYAGLIEQIDEMAPQVIKKDPGNLEAAGFLLPEYYQQNRYEDAAKIADNVLKAGKSDAVVLNIGGTAHFATQDFKRAKELFTKAEEENQLIRELGGRYLPLCDKYQELWDEEQKIRAAEKKADDLPRVEFVTSKGRIVLELFENEAPNTVANFISLVEKGFYDGIAFHRVIPNFMTQGGDPNTLDDNPGNDGQGGPGYNIDCECYDPKFRKHFQGSLSMAHAGRNTGGSQFFLTHLPTDHLDGKHTVFGRIIEGMEVKAAMEQVDVIKSAKVLRKRDHAYNPKTKPE